MTANAWFRWLVCAVVCSSGASAVARADAQAVRAQAADAQASAPSMSPVVRSGEIDSSLQPHPGTSVQWGRAEAIVDAPADAVMAVLQNYGGYKDFLPNFQASRVLSQRGSAALVYMQVSVMRGAAQIWVELKLRERAVQGTTRTIDATMTKGNVDHFEARWQVTPLDAQRSVVSFQILVDPNLPLPASMVDGENQKNARKALGALRTTMAAQRAALAQTGAVKPLPVQAP